MNRRSDMESVARSFLNYVRLHSSDGSWVPAARAFATAVKECRMLEWVRHIENTPGAKIGFTKVLADVGQREFRDIERMKRGPQRSSPVFYRVRPSQRNA